jgi:hypothetical protein
MMKKIFTLACLLSVATLSTAWADTLTLRDGSQIQGTLVSADRDFIVIRGDNGVEHRLEIREVQSLTFSSSLSSTPASGDSSGNFVPASHEALVVPTGAEIAVRTNEGIDSREAREGQTFSAELANDVLGDSGQVLLPKGSDAELVLRDVSTGSTTGSPEITLDLRSVTVGGHRYLVSTTDLQEKNNRGLGKNRRTATMVGGGAVLGTLLGAIAGGGKGAAIGALSGAAVGGTAQVLTKGKEVHIPSETILRFRLDQPLSLKRSD